MLALCVNQFGIAPLKLEQVPIPLHESKEVYLSHLIDYNCKKLSVLLFTYNSISYDLDSGFYQSCRC